MEYIGHYFGHRLFRNGKGEIEGYKSLDFDKVSEMPTNIDRIVTTATTIEEFGKWIKGLNSKPKQTIKYDPYQDINQLKIELS